MIDSKRVVAIGGLVGVFLFAASAQAQAQSCGNFPFTLGPGLGSAGRNNVTNVVGDVVSVTFTNPGTTSTLRVFKSSPAPVVDIVPRTGAASGSGTYVATTSGLYAYFADRSVSPYDNNFATVNFTCAAAAAPVPTLSEWAMILLGMLLAGGAALTLQRQKAVRVRA